MEDRYYLYYFSCKTISRKKARQGSEAVSLLKPEETGIDFINKVVDGETFNILTYVISITAEVWRRRYK